MTEPNSLPIGGGDRLAAPQDSQLATAELDPIIDCFVRGHKQFISSPSLKLEYTETSIRLSDRESKLVGISKQVNQLQRKVLLSNKSEFRQRIVQATLQLGFITKQKSAHPEFSEHHYYEVPDGYQLKYTEVIELWKVWWHNKRYQLNVPNPPIDVLTFTKGKWYSIRDLQPKQGNFIICTDRGEIAIEPEDYVVWLESKSLSGSEPKSLTPSQILLLDRQQIRATNSSLPIELDRQSEPNIAIEVPISGSITPAVSAKATGSTSLNSPAAKSTMVDRQVDGGEEYEDVDLESYLNTFNTEDTEDIDRIEGIYHINELLSGNVVERDDVPPATVTSDASALPVTPQPPTAPLPSIAPQPSTALSAPQAAAIPTESLIPDRSPLSLSQRQADLKTKAIEVLAKYLQEGDLIVHTEVLKNALGQEVNRKVSTIQRGCPGWAIAQVQQLIS
ncbi:hypothetical protein [Chamaesiphon sp. VAR_69_metabat_338]|uniref:hypothetical protein n=1 Tax=Chamaesiphon sp. VAR_69_metabat_338 TaxID=2964704 RepID=UPI00286D6C69|nr:hypothetical protein [Chamaesiphon sp. VAR_69_metabat_338]